MSAERKEAQCPFCMSTEHYKYEYGKNGPEYAFSLGHYGLQSVTYARMLSARWYELTGGSG